MTDEQYEAPIAPPAGRDEPKGIWLVLDAFKMLGFGLLLYGFSIFFWYGLLSGGIEVDNPLVSLVGCATLLVILSPIFFVWEIISAITHCTPSVKEQIEASKQNRPARPDY